MYSLPFYKINPSGNMTLLFEGLDYTKAEQCLFATQGLINLGGEQAGFIDIAKGILHMAGGEFCINATRSLGLLMARAAGWHSPHLDFECMIKVSGFNEPLFLQARLIDGNTHIYNIALTVPLDSKPAMRKLDKGIYIVSLPGISHVLIHELHHPFSASTWDKDSAHIRKKYDLEQENAVGCIWWHEAQKQEHECQDMPYPLHMHPIVWVKEPRALHYENSCGSGTLVLGLWHYARNAHKTFIMHQPGGHLTLDLQEDIQGLKGIIGGPVHIVAEGTAYLS